MRQNSIKDSENRRRQIVSHYNNQEKCIIVIIMSVTVDKNAKSLEKMEYSKYSDKLSDINRTFISFKRIKKVWEISLEILIHLNV